MSIVNYIDLFIGALINMLLYVYVIKNVFNIDFNKDNKIVILNLFISAIIVALINIFDKDTFKILLTFPFIVIAIKYIFNSNYNKTLLYVIFSILYIFVGELVVGILFSFLPFDHNFIFNNVFGTIIGNIIVFISTIPLINMNKINKIVNKLVITINDKGNTFIYIFIVLAIGSFAYKISINLNNNIGIIINITIALVFIAMVYMYYKENAKSEELSKNYNELLNYLEKYEKELVEKRKIIHDYKNQLIIINSYIGNNNKLKEYMKELIYEQKNISENSIIKNIDKLPKGLKGLIYYKFSQIDEKIKITLQVSSSLKSFDKLSPKLNKEILKIIGILIDNSIEAVNQEKNEKNINIEFLVKNGVLKMILINTCNQKLNIESIMNSGFSTKGKNRGYGLALVKDILKEENNIKLNLKQDNNEFISELKVNIK